MVLSCGVLVKGEIHFSHVFELSQEQRTKGELSSDEKQPGVLTGPYLAKAKTVATSGKVYEMQIPKTNKWTDDRHVHTVK